MWSLVSNMLPLYVRIYVGLSTSSPHRSIPTNLSSILRDLDLIELMIVFNGFQVMGKDNGPFHTKDEEVEFRRQKFAGSQADRKEREEAETVMVAAQLQKTNVSDSSGKKKQEPTTSAAESEISISRLDICVGLITKAEKHPDADSLYVEDIDAGEGQTRTVVSGLVKYIPQEKNAEPETMCTLQSEVSKHAGY